MYAEERQQAMAQQISQVGRSSVAELAALYQVTTETVRRDLGVLERIGLIRRVHGGAMPTSALALIETGLSERADAHKAQKETIATHALGLLPPTDSTIIVDAGTTTERLVALLPHDARFTIITHAVPIAARLASRPGVDLVLLPGRVRTTTQAAVGSDTCEAIGHLRADLVILGTNGYTAADGLSTPDRDEAAVKRAIVGAGRRVIALADSSKAGIATTHVFCRTAQLDVLVTDAGIAHHERAAFEAAGVEVVVT